MVLRFFPVGALPPVAAKGGITLLGVGESDRTANVSSANADWFIRMAVPLSS